MNSLEMQINEKQLISACNKYFGSYQKAIECSGISYEQIKKYKNKWNREMVIQELTLRHKNGLSLNSLSVKDEDIALHNACNRIFGSYEKAIESSGLVYNEIQAKNKWSKEKIVQELEKRKQKNLPLNANSLSADNKSLYAVCIRYFGSLEVALDKLGIKYESIREDYRTLSYYGRKFEVFLSKIFDELSITYTKKYTNEIRPDFILNKYVWCDAKLSYHSIYGSGTIKKYEPFCKLLTIVYLRGDKEVNTMITDKTRMLSVYQLIKQFPKSIRSKFELEANQLWDEVEQSDTGDKHE